MFSSAAVLGFCRTGITVGYNRNVRSQLATAILANYSQKKAKKGEID
jgi:hypothetical protein